MRTNLDTRKVVEGVRIGGDNGSAGRSRSGRYQQVVGSSWPSGTLDRSEKESMLLRNG